jgi:tetratricopeptide (TPR) repeat protein
MKCKDSYKETFFNMRGDVLVCLFVILTTLAVYWQVTNHAFVNFDDDKYVSENKKVQAGLTLESLSWSFSFSHHSDQAHWHPLTWLSYMLDCELYGLRSDMHHLTNVILHLANCLLLFVIFRRMTGALWRSAFVAALFALHPLNVDSVAWVAQRKNVLSTFFWMLTLLAYVHYSKGPRLRRYLIMYLFFILGLMSKPMLVTLPFTLLLLDYWPLGRFSLGRSEDERPVAFRLVLEKAPLFVLSGVSIFLSSLSQQHYGVVVSTESVPMKLRVENALVSYVNYIGKMLWPENLTVFYPFPKMLPMWQAAGAFVLIAFVTVLIIGASKRKPYLAVGWLWYLGTLVPVIGLMQVGLWPAMADRWAYVPLIGLFIIIAWGTPEIVARWRYKEIGLATAVVLVLFIVWATTWIQVRYWTNSITLFEHAIAVDSNNPIAHYNLGAELAERNRIAEAVYHYTEALRIDPDYAAAHNNLGVALVNQGRSAEAINHYSEALRINRGFEGAHYNLGVALAKEGRIAEAIRQYNEALRIKPDFDRAHNNLGIALAKQGRISEAIHHYSEALRIKPDFAEAHNNLANALAKQGGISEAIHHYSEALRIAPLYEEAHNNLGVILAKQGRTAEAISHYSEALRINRDSLEAHINLGNALVTQGDLDGAVQHFTEALKLNPGYAEVHNCLGGVLIHKGRVEEAVDHFREALRIRPDYAEARENLERVLTAKGKFDKAFIKTQ